MNLVIKTGFGLVTHEIAFNPNVVLNGKALAVSHVVRVEELRSDKFSELIRGSVIPQTSVHASPYKGQIHLSGKRHVTEVSCTCAPQAGAKCKHIYALIHYVNSNRSVTKTSLEQEWGKPSDKQLGHEMYAKPMTIATLFPSKVSTDNPVSSSVDHLDLQLQELTHACALRTMLREYAISESERLVKSLLRDCIYCAIENSDNSQCEACILNLLLFCEDNETYDSKENYGNLNGPLEAFYKREVSLTDTLIIDVCVETRNQARSDKWFAVREIRISGSSKAHAIRTRKSKTVDALINDFLTHAPLKGTAKKNVQYGTKNEWTALDEYRTNDGVKVVQIGVVVSKSQPWLCASPDGIVIEDGIITKLVDIKCPTSCAKLPIVDNDSNKINVSYLHFFNGNVDLKESHAHYTQCQVQLYVTGLTVCDLYVWSPKGSCLVPVHRNESHLKSLILKLESFYFQHFLKVLAHSSNENDVNNNNDS